jgi:hypothetical protein
MSEIGKKEFFFCFLFTPILISSVFSVPPW